MIPKEDRVGIYITVIIHLTVIIILLLVQIGREAAKEHTFVLDFTKQEELEKEQAEQNFKEDISKRLDDLIGAAPSSRDVRNVAVDRSALKDDRNTDADQLYKDAERLAQELKNGQNQKVEDATDEAVDLGRDDSKSKDKPKEFSGASVLSYNLDGRKMTVMKVPAYQCFGSGVVTVIIKVNNAGKVTEAKILEEGSSSDQCLREQAKLAAGTSTFQASTTAPAYQLGDITYQFIAQ